LTAPVLTVLTVALGTVFFALFGWALARAKEKFGFNPLVVALLWVLFELAAIKSGVLPDPLETHNLIRSSVLFHGWAVLFGLLAVSFVIVLVNSLLVFVIDKTISLAKARGQGVWVNVKRMGPCSHTRAFLAQKVCLIPRGRAPPVLMIP
jgi:apolipoprotein N-acyltransferase